MSTPKASKPHWEQMHELAMVNPLNRQLEEKLLSIGGTRVVWMCGIEPHVKQLLSHGQLFSLLVKRCRGGQDSSCHENTAVKWGKNPKKYTLVTGYSLSADELWRPHSWVVDSKTLHETTCVRELYFGASLTTVEAMHFWFSNIAAGSKLSIEEVEVLLKTSYPKLFPIWLEMARSAAEDQPNARVHRVLFP